MVWRFYNLQRAVEFTGLFWSHLTEQEKIATSLLTKGKRDLPTVPAEVQGTERLKMGIEMAISDDARSDAEKWRAIAVEKEQRAVENEQAARKWRKMKIALAKDRREREIEKKAQDHRRQLESDRPIALKSSTIQAMLTRHVEYWAQHVEDDIPNLGEVFGILSSDTKTSVQELRRGWHEYEERRKWIVGSSLKDPYRVFDQKEKDEILSRKWPSWLRGAIPEIQETRDALEAHIIRSITDDIVADRAGWDRLRRKEEERKQLYLDQRPERIARHRVQFTSRILETFGQEVFDLISEDDITAYSEGMADRKASKERLWNAVIDKYDFDQNTSSCLYFIRQGASVKIGITSNLERRVAQIKTSAKQPCEIENVVYTHYGQLLERKLHRALAEYNTHLEWFDLPPRIKEILFKAKSKKDVERVIEQLAQGQDK